MVGVETPRSWAVRFIDRPLTYSSTAATFRASGLPRGGAVHRQTAHIQQHGSHFQGQRLAAGGCVGEVQAAALAQGALLGAHQPVLDVLFAPAALASKSHSQSPWRSSSTRNIGHLCRSQTIVERAKQKARRTRAEAGLE